MSEVGEKGFVVPSFDSVSDLRAGLEAKRAFIKDPDEAVDLYYRDGSRLLGKVEAQLADLAGVDAETLLAYNTGMSAVTDSIDTALHTADTDKPVLVCSLETYTQTKRYLENFIRGKRAQVYYFDSGNTDEVARVLEERQPDVIVAETISNYINVPVLDTEHFLGHVRQADKQPAIVLDNTLPLSTGLPLGEVLTPDDKVIVVESGTKSYILNGDLLGVGYTQNEELFDLLRRVRRTRGSLPGPSHATMIDELLPESREEFDDINRRVFKKTGDIAIQLAAAAPEDTHFTIQHPAIPSHDNHELYTRAYPGGGAPVLYIFSPHLDQYKVAELLWSNEEVRAEETRIGQSFGFDHTRIVADEDVGAVRIAGGAETDSATLGKALAEALYIDR
jgi:cystathionine beta-lyase/cystathionine gamma-synthase